MYQRMVNVSKDGECIKGWRMYQRMVNVSKNDEATLDTIGMGRELMAKNHSP